MKEDLKIIQLQARRRARRVRAKISGTSARPRLSVHVSNKRMYAQGIDDQAGKTLVAISSRPLEGGKTGHLKVESAQQLGRKFAELALEKGIQQVVFDRGAKAYQGRVKAFAEGAREGGLKF